MTKNYAAAMLIERLVQDVYVDRHSTAIQPLQWSIMRYLKSSKGDPLDVTTIAKYLGRTNPPISRAVTTLHRRGLVDKDPTPGSASVSITITEAGLQELQRDPLRRLADWLEDLAEPDRNVFLTVVRDIAVMSHQQGISRSE